MNLSDAVGARDAVEATSRRRLFDVSVVDGWNGSTTSDGGGGRDDGAGEPGAVLNVEEFIMSQLGSRTRNRAESILLTTVYAVVFTTGVVGNVCTCVVIMTNSSMRTATNYYLFSLAVSDVLTLLLGNISPILLFVLK